MIPHLSQALTDLAGKIATDIAPETSSRFAMANTGMIAMLLTALAQETERAVASRMADVEDLQRLFATLDRRADPDHAEARVDYVARHPASLALSDVDALHADGMRLLIHLHAWAEDHDEALTAGIWDLLAEHTERNRLDLG